eukprot:3789442-Rhodomonas_salina.1
MRSSFFAPADAQSALGSDLVLYWERKEQQRSGRQSFAAPRKKQVSELRTNLCHVPCAGLRAQYSRSGTEVCVGYALSSRSPVPTWRRITDKENHLSALLQLLEKKNAAKKPLSSPTGPYAHPDGWPSTDTRVSVWTDMRVSV